MSHDFDVVTGPTAAPPKDERVKPPEPARRDDGDDKIAAVPRTQTASS